MTASFYRLRHLALGELSAGDDLFGAIVRGALNGVIVRGVLAPERAAAVVERLEAGAVDVAPRRFAKEFEAYSIGPCLDQAEGGLDEYLEAAPAFAAAAALAFEEDIHARIGRVLAVIAGGRPLGVPRDARGKAYGFTTLRRLPPGGLIPPHCENEQIARAPYDDLRARIDPAVLVSFYLTLAPAEEGGELSIHALGARELLDLPVRARHSDPAQALAGREALVVKPRAGDLIVFDGGRFCHQVLPVRGAKDRWTMGGFMALSASGGEVLAWA